MKRKVSDARNQLFAAPLNITGTVTSISVFGNGPISSELVVDVQPLNGDLAAFRIGAYPATEPIVFTSISAMLTAAYLAKTTIELFYRPNASGTPLIIGIALPPVS
jgi:hypothetical protein